MGRIGDLTVILRARSGDRRGRASEGLDRSIPAKGCGRLETWRSFSARGLETGASGGGHMNLHYLDETHRLTWIEPFDLLLF